MKKICIYSPSPTSLLFFPFCCLSSPDMAMTHLAVLQVQRGWFYHAHLWSIAFGVGTIYQEHFSCTTQILCLHQKAIFRLLYAMSQSMPRLQLTMTCTSFLGIFLPSSIHTPSQSMTPPRWSRAALPLLGNSNKTILSLIRLTRICFVGRKRASPLAAGVLAVLNVPRLGTQLSLNQAPGLRDFVAL